MYYRVLVASHRYHGKEGLTYSSSNELASGQIVQVMLNNKKALGIIENKTAEPEFTTKDITNHWNIILPESSMQLMQWIRQYYPSALGVITELFTPPALTANVPKIDDATVSSTQKKLPVLTKDQADALKLIYGSKSKSFLLHGNSGSGKTRIYLELSNQILSENKSVILMTPEIGLTKPLLNIFKSQFGNRVVVTHSLMTPVQRRKVWLKIIDSPEPLIIIGPRSALFMPIKNIGIIIMDECHDNAYKQEKSPHYLTSRVAGKLANINDALFVMGSATPSITDYFIFEEKKLPIIRITKPAIVSSTKINKIIVDLKDKTLFTKSNNLSNPLLNALENALNNHEQSILFLNRRGSARLIHCTNCGWQAKCNNCDSALTFHQDSHTMVCHSCEFKSTPPKICPSCNNSELIYKSIGTKALEAEIKKLFPNASVLRFDRDNSSSDNINNQFENLNSGKIDIIIGTQTIAKGFDLPSLSVVGIVNADGGLQFPDYTSAEKNFQLISQVSGRIGRGHRNSTLVVQSYNPNSKQLKDALNKRFEEFYTEELQQRLKYRFPPYYYLLKLSCERASRKSSIESCNKLIINLKNKYKHTQIEGPAPRFIEKINGKYTWHCIVKSKNRNTLISIINDITPNVKYDIDPSDLL